MDGTASRSPEIATDGSARRRPTQDEVAQAYRDVRRLVNARFRSLPRAERDDLLHDLVIVLLTTGVDIFDEERGTFSALAKSIARMRSPGLLRRLRGRAVPVDDLSMVEDTGAHLDRVVLASEVVDAKDAAPADGWERRAFDLWLAGYEETEIAASLEVDKGTVSRAMRRRIVWTARMLGLQPPPRPVDTRDRATAAVIVDERQGQLFTEAMR